MKKRDQESLMTQSYVQGESVYGEKRVSVTVWLALRREEKRRSNIELGLL